MVLTLAQVQELALSKPELALQLELIEASGQTYQTGHLMHSVVEVWLEKEQEQHWKQN